MIRRRVIGLIRRRRGLLGALALVGALVAAELLGGSSGNATKPAPPLPAAVLQPPKATLATLRGKPGGGQLLGELVRAVPARGAELERLARSLGGRAQLVGVDWSDGLASARSFVREYGWSFPVLRDSSGTVGERYGVVGLPTTFILDPQGRIVRTLRGPQTAQDLRQAIGATR